MKAALHEIMYAETRAHARDATARFAAEYGEALRARLAQRRAYVAARPRRPPVTRLRAPAERATSDSSGRG